MRDNEFFPAGDEFSAPGPEYTPPKPEAHAYPPEFGQRSEKPASSKKKRRRFSPAMLAASAALTAAIAASSIAGGAAAPPERGYYISHEGTGFIGYSEAGDVVPAISLYYGNDPEPLDIADFPDAYYEILDQTGDIRILDPADSPAGYPACTTNVWVSVCNYDTFRNPDTPGSIKIHFHAAGEDFYSDLHWYPVSEIPGVTVTEVPLRIDPGRRFSVWDFVGLPHGEGWDSYGLISCDEAQTGPLQFDPEKGLQLQDEPQWLDLLKTSRTASLDISGRGCSGSSSGYDWYCLLLPIVIDG